MNSEEHLRTILLEFKIERDGWREGEGEQVVNLDSFQEEGCDVECCQLGRF